MSRGRRTIRLRLLGAVDLRDRDGCEVSTVLAQPRRLALLAHLALTPPGDFHRRATLVAMFWPEHDELHGRAALRQALHFLRRALGADALLTRGAEEVRLDERVCWCDVAAFDAAIAAGDLAAAVELYRGDLLEGFYIADGEIFEPWIESQRSRLLRAYTTALESIAIGCEERGEHARAVAYWHRLVARVPESGRAVLRLMQALAHMGDRTEALRQAELYRVRIQREYAADPDPAVVALVELLRRAG
ncbi:MAG TPA: bacterial transcriptional activator domain-containing protein [Gemmatimonadaceae bacterium]|nr:bacterial transcriptional activator domain-containing protein [Gemmatimonadaceae bacterium]